MEENKIPSADDFLQNHPSAAIYLTRDMVLIYMIDFAKAHVKAALNAACEEVPDDELVWEDSHDYSKGVERVDTTYKNDVLNSYPPENIV
jgi:hypothetical protein